LQASQLHTGASPRVDADIHRLRHVAYTCCAIYAQLTARAVTVSDTDHVSMMPRPPLPGILSLQPRQRERISPTVARSCTPRNSLPLYVHTDVTGAFVPHTVQQPARRVHALSATQVLDTQLRQSEGQFCVGGDSLCRYGYLGVLSAARKFTRSIRGGKEARPRLSPVFSGTSLDHLALQQPATRHCRATVTMAGADRKTAVGSHVVQRGW